MDTALIFLEEIKKITENSSPKPPLIWDFGSGNGIPAIPLALALENYNFNLIERSKRRTSFLNLCLLSLNLGDRIRVFNRDFNSIKDEADFVSFTALSQFDTIEKSLYDSLRQGGGAFLYKGPKVFEEFSNLKFFDRDKAKIFTKIYNGREHYLLFLEK